uniref:Uncharacterized protein n=1 Tax=Octopus bimaculoides TaxID=37653 RepID=A0A0L8FUC7_OCTBM
MHKLFSSPFSNCAFLFDFLSSNAWSNLTLTILISPVSPISHSLFHFLSFFLHIVFLSFYFIYLISSFVFYLLYFFIFISYTFWVINIFFFYSSFSFRFLFFFFQQYYKH